MLGFAGLARVRSLPRAWQVLLAIFLGTQLLAALLTPEPLWSVPLALGRGLLVVGLLTTGFVLADIRPYRAVLIGYGVLAVTAFVTTLSLHPGAAFTTRLVHPYFTTVSLGLAGTLGLLLAVTWRSGPVVWRLLGGVLSLGMFLWSGSRGPLIALAAGLLAALVVSLRGQWRAAALAILGVAAVGFLLQQAVPGGVVARFGDDTLTGRGAYWVDALETARALPWGGTGPYQLGPHLSTQYGPESCRLWLQGEAVCPPALEAVRGAWLIAHNTAFHLLGETGVIGLSGWLALMGSLAVSAWRARDSLVNAVTWAVAAMGLVDNPTLLPNLGHAELYWLLSGTGIALASRPQPAGRSTLPLAPVAPLLACALLAYLSVPTWLERVLPMPPLNLPVLRALTLPRQLRAGESVTVFLDAAVPAGAYRLEGLACRKATCTTVSVTTLTGPADGWRTLGMKIPTPGTYAVKLRVRDDRSGLRLALPLVELTREVTVE